MFRNPGTLYLLFFGTGSESRTTTGVEIDTDVDVDSNCKHYADNEHENVEAHASVTCGNKTKET
jgi:hypothetical protein